MPHNQRFPVAYVAEGVPSSTLDLAGAAFWLLNDARQMYGKLLHPGELSLGQLWRIARDLVLATERWSTAVNGLTGRRKMELALDVGWQLLVQHGGDVTLRKHVISALDTVLPGAAARTAARWVVSERVVKGIVRVVLELAVREMWGANQLEAHKHV